MQGASGWLVLIPKVQRAVVSRYGPTVVSSTVPWARKRIVKSLGVRPGIQPRYRCRKDEPAVTGQLLEDLTPQYRCR